MTRELAVDVAVLGLGPGGGEVAERLAEAGLGVVGIERHLVGGECPYYGCIPTKMMTRAASALAEGRRIDQLAGHARVEPDFAPVAARIRAEATDDWDDAVAVRRLEELGGTFLRGSGTLAGPRRVQVGDTTVTAGRGVVIATGTAPTVPGIDGLGAVEFWTNRDVVKATSAPASLVVLGGGAIGAESAQAFARFGSRVSIVEGRDRLLAVEEPEVSDVIDTAFDRDGIDVHLGRRAERVGSDDGLITVTLDDGSRLSGERLLVATGRHATLPGLGLETVGLDPDARSIDVDALCRTAVDGIWAIGDVTGRAPFTHVAVQHARLVIDQILGRDPVPMDYRGIAWVTFTDPEVGRVGMTEEQARDAGVDVRTATVAGGSSSRGWIHGPGNDGVIKLVADAATGVLVGATSAGPRGGEVLAMLTLAVHAQVPVDTLATMVYAYPTFHRGVLDAVRALQ